VIECVRATGLLALAWFDAHKSGVDKTLSINIAHSAMHDEPDDVVTTRNVVYIGLQFQRFNKTLCPFQPLSRPFILKPQLRLLVRMTPHQQQAKVKQGVH
jgi:hypothetical protein